MSISIIDKEIKNIYCGNKQITKVYDGDKLIYKSRDYLCFISLDDGNDISFNTSIVFGTLPSIEYSKDNITWTTYSFGNTITLNNGEKCFWRGNNNFFSISSTQYIYFRATKRVQAEGNLMSLLDKTCKSTTIPCEYCFNELFSNCTYLLTAPKIPATALKASCYRGMFMSCINLTTPPELPAVTLAENCYERMFIICEALTSAPQLPALSIPNSAYDSMFARCTSLTTMPSLPGMDLGASAYAAMFYNCTNLRNVSQLPALVLGRASYATMFFGCTSLTNAPEILATTLDTYSLEGMFHECVNLNKIKVYFSTWGPSGGLTTSQWMKNVSAQGTFICPSSLPQTRGIDYIPQNWTIQTF